MKKNLFFTTPYFVKGAKNESNIQDFIKNELRSDFPFLMEGKKERPPQNAYYYEAVLTRTLKGVTTVLFQLFYNETPIWNHGVNITYETSSYGILSSSRSDFKEAVIAKTEIKNTKANYDIDASFISKTLDIDRNILRLKALKIDLEQFKYEITINSEKQIVYQFKAEERQHSHGHNHEHESKGEDDETIENVGIFRDLPHLRIPDVPQDIKENNYYAATEILFSITMPWGILHWRLITENASGTVLHVGVLSDNLGGYIYDDAPSAMTGDISILPTSPLTTLNDIRNPRAIANLNSAIPPYVLSGEYVELAELTPPINTPPSTATNFDYDVPTEDFAAVNAYVHNDYLFRLVSDMGFDMAVYFDGTTFPVPVDHNGFFGCVNACAPGNATGDGSGGFHYGLIQSGTTVGIALSRRIALHEFGHAILWDNVHSPNLGFCHSVGDSLAAILMDPRSINPDRFVTFPWLTIANPGIDRRHDRSVASGWDWYGVNDDGGYGSEQILSSTHFRLYQSLGGDSKDLCTREWAARYTAYLIFFSVGSLTPMTNSNSPEHWANVMIQSDFATVDFECHIGRVVHKVIRWAFEKQNAFNGLPPVYDVYIDDGRKGEYEYSEDICDTLDIWNRQQPDNGNDNQMPIVGEINYAYVIVRNRGQENTGSIEVKGFKNTPQCCSKAKADLCWPLDFIELQKPVLHHQDIQAGDYEIIGPFEWVPCSKNDSLLFSVSSKGDVSNIEIIRSGYSVEVMKLAAWDNNIAFKRNCNTSKCC